MRCDHIDVSDDVRRLTVAVPIDDPLDQAVAAINRGDRAAGDGAGRNRYSAADGANAEAEDLSGRTCRSW